MVGIKFKHKGDFSKLDKFLNKLLKKDYLNVAEKYAKKGLALLREATPKDTGITASSWDYRIESNDERTSIIYLNSNIVKGVNIALILHYGHGTRNGGYVVGRNYINEAIQPLFDEIVSEAWKEVTALP